MGEGVTHWEQDFPCFNHSYLEEAIEKQGDHYLYLPFSHDVHFVILHLEGIIGGQIHFLSFSSMVGSIDEATRRGREKFFSTL